METTEEQLQEEIPSGSSTATMISSEASWIVAARMAVLSVVLFAASMCSFFYPVNAMGWVSELYPPIALLFAYSAFSALWIKDRSAGSLFVSSQLVSDAIIITGVIYITGGPASPFLFLYLPLVMAASIFASRQTALFTSLVCGTAYCALVWLMFKGVLIPLDESLVVHVPAGGILLQCVGLCSAMVLVAVATSFLVGKMGSHYEHALQSQKVLSQLTQEQNALFEGMTEGIVTTNANFSIVSINSAATSLLELDPKESTGKKLAPALISSCYQADIEQAVLQERRSGEFTLQRNADDREICISFQSRSIPGENGTTSGWMFIFYDVTHLRSIEEQLNVQERMARLLASDSSAHIGSSSFLKEFVGESPLMKKVFGLIERVAPSDATVLISGASGTGKELVARSIHLGGPRSSKPFVPVNCGAIPEGLIESELFGHKKGAFTGADSDHTGLFRRAEGGTVFLDEIGELPLLMQAKLLRALQEKRVRPVGGDSSLPIDVRIIAATNRNLREESKEGKFREDLYYRLNVINICLPALKDRREDIPLLVNSILKRIVDKDITPVVAPAVLQKLMSYDYPGNVRELENILERAVVFGGEAILPEHLPDLFSVDSAETAGATAAERPDTAIIELDYVQFPLNLDEFLKDLEKRYIETALSKSGGVKKRAAEMLGMNFRSFRYRLQKFDIDRE